MAKGKNAANNMANQQKSPTRIKHSALSVKLDKRRFGRALAANIDVGEEEAKKWRGKTFDGISEVDAQKKRKRKELLQRPGSQQKLPNQKKADNLRRNAPSQGQSALDKVAAKLKAAKLKELASKTVVENSAAKSVQKGAIEVSPAEERRQAKEKRKADRLAKRRGYRQL
eukprot:TRINITY_DN97086_c0_g1_i1.p2 TRINITY_DN97086_c0_g1~~TRINITY_DN97086_c0_g1_i1.p2  ORF type:complete len:170 (+),score=52.03 TRINITY_DN97086_c0_g1_i1:99-608(+)